MTATPWPTTISALFTDGAFTQLRGDVEQADITALRERLSALSSFYMDQSRLSDELNLAQALLDKEDDALGLVKKRLPEPQHRRRRRQGRRPDCQRPPALGITAAAGATVAIYADLPDDATVYVVPTSSTASRRVEGHPRGPEERPHYITIEKIGSLSATRGGPLYLTYAGSNPEQIKLQVRVLTNAWEMPVLELSNWYALGEDARKEAIGAYVDA